MNIQPVKKIESVLFYRRSSETGLNKRSQHEDTFRFSRRSQEIQIVLNHINDKEKNRLKYLNRIHSKIKHGGYKIDKEHIADKLLNTI